MKEKTGFPLCFVLFFVTLLLEQTYYQLNSEKAYEKDAIDLPDADDGSCRQRSGEGLCLHWEQREYPQGPGHELSRF